MKVATATDFFRQLDTKDPYTLLKSKSKFYLKTTARLKLNAHFVASDEPNAFLWPSTLEPSLV